MIRKAPPIEAIEVFVAAAQGDSFREVGRRLALSPSAVSRRIAALETFLGTPLFDRRGQTQVLNQAGQRYLALVQPAMDAIQRATAMLVGCDQPCLRIATSHSFAATWLLPRLPDLKRKCGIEVELIATRDINALRSGEAQLAIWGGMPAPEDVIAERLFDVVAVPVAAPFLSDGRLPPRSAQTLLDYPLIGVRTPGRMWERWLAAAGIPVDRLEMRYHETLQLTYEAAAAGLGISLAMPLISEPFLASGKLLPCAGGPHPVGEAYHLFRARRRNARSEEEQRFARWLQEEVARSLDAFARVVAPQPVRTAPAQMLEQA